MNIRTDDLDEPDVDEPDTSPRGDRILRDHGKPMQIEAASSTVYTTGKGSASAIRVQRVGPDGRPVGGANVYMKKESQVAVRLPNGIDVAWLSRRTSEVLVFCRMYALNNGGAFPLIDKIALGLNFYKPSPTWTAEEAWRVRKYAQLTVRYHIRKLLALGFITKLPVGQRSQAMGFYRLIGADEIGSVIGVEVADSVLGRLASQMPTDSLRMRIIQMKREMRNIEKELHERERRQARPFGFATPEVELAEPDTEGN